MKKYTVSSVLGTGLVIAGLTLTGVAGPAFAHTPEVTASCTALTIKLTSYSTQSGNATPNEITVTVDGKSAGPIKFGTGYASEIALDGTVGHSYKVVVDALGTTYDKTIGEGVTVACVEVPTSTETPKPTPTTPAVPGVLAVTEVPAVPAVPTTSIPTPAATTPSATTPSVTPTADSQKLAETGTDGAPVLAAGFLTVLAGAGVLLFARRLRRTQH